MNFMDLVALAKAGYKYNEVKELLAMEPPAPEPEKPAEAPTEPDYKALYEELKAEKKPDDEPDYKALYEAEKAAKEKLQADNLNRPRGEVQPTQTDLEYVTELFKNI